MNLNNKTILCVDDDEDDLSMLRETIKEIGTDFRILEAFDGLHAMELLQQMKDSGELPCLIVLDINMPRMDGKQTLVALQNHKDFSAIPVVLFSTSSSHLDKTFSQMKKVELITKPLDYKTLFVAARKLLSYCEV